MFLCFFFIGVTAGSLMLIGIVQITLMLVYEDVMS